MVRFCSNLQIGYGVRERVKDKCFDLSNWKDGAIVNRLEKQRSRLVRDDQEFYFGHIDRLGRKQQRNRKQKQSLVS